MLKLIDYDWHFVSVSLAGLIGFVEMLKLIDYDWHKFAPILNAALSHVEMLKLIDYDWHVTIGEVKSFSGPGRNA